MKTISYQAEKRRNRRLRRNAYRLAVELHGTWLPVAAPVGGDALIYEWEQQLRRHFRAERDASGPEQAASWMSDIVHAAAGIDVHFQADLMAAAMSVGVYVPLRIDSVHTLGPGRRSPVVPNSTRVVWSRAKG